MSLVTNLQTAFTRIGSEFKAIRTLVGGSGTATITALTTTDKSSLVAAINEVKAGSSGAPPAASTTVAGIVELATNTETTAGTDVTLATTPAGVAAALATIPAQPAASDTVAGLVELATTAEATTGTDTARAITAAGLKAGTDAAISALVNGAPTALDTLKELADQLASDESGVGALTTTVAGKQPLDADLTAIAGLTSAADKVPYATGSGAWALTTFTAAGRALVDDADAAAQRATLAVYSTTEIGDPTTDFAAGFAAALA